MKKYYVIFSFIFIILGICIITLSKIIEEVMPKLGFIAYQAAVAGSYSPDNYQVNLVISYLIGTVCILIGIVYLIIQSNYMKNSIKEIELRNKEFDERNKIHHQ